MRTQCPTCDQYFDGRCCECGYFAPLVPQEPRIRVRPSTDSPPLTDDERQAFFVELKDAIAKVGTGQPPQKSVMPTLSPKPSVFADHRRIEQGGAIPRGSVVMVQPCGCLYEDRPPHNLLAMCAACRDKEDSLLNTLAHKAKA